MNSSINSNYFPSRQRELQLQILEALKKEDVEEIDFLKSKWVHRFGLDSLPEDQENIQNSIDFYPESNKTEVEIEEIKNTDEIEVENKNQTPSKNNSFNESIPPVAELNKNEFSSEELILNPPEEINLKSMFEDNQDNTFEEIAIENEINEQQFKQLDHSEEIVDDQVIDFREEFIENPLEEIADDHIQEDQSISKDLVEENVLKDNQSGIKKIHKRESEIDKETIVEVPPPPPPSLNNLRRWLN